MEATYLDAAFRIGARLVRDAIWHGGRCNWFGPVYEEVGGKHRLGSGTLGPSVYEGTAGIALFLAELHRATGDHAVAATAGAALAHALSRSDDVPASVPLGFYTGLTGIAYSAAEVGRCLGREDFVRAGLEVAASLGEINLDGKTLLDVMSGYAGAIPALLRMARIHGDDRLLELARAGGEVLLENAVAGPRGLSWNSLAEMSRMVELSVSEDIAAAFGGPGRPHLIGLSHGAGGISWALLELAAATGDQRFAKAARAGFDYEDSWFDPDRGQWPELRCVDEAAPPVSPPSAWCHGAVGIGLARTRAFQLSGDPADREMALAAIDAASRSLRAALSSASPNFSLCHGLAGEAELFLSWSMAMNDERCRGIADEVAARGLEDHHGQGRPPWPSGLAGAPEAPGLMLGIAGTGYFYLRADDPRRTPSVLLVETRADLPAVAGDLRCPRGEGLAPPLASTPARGSKPVASGFLGLDA